MNTPEQNNTDSLPDDFFGYHCPLCGCTMDVDDRDLSFPVDGYEVEITEIILTCPGCGFSDDRYED